MACVQEQVDDQKERAQDFVLPRVVAFVHQQPRRDRHGAGDDSAEGDCTKATPREEQVGQTAIRLGHQQSVARLRQRERTRGKREAEQRIGKTPQQAEPGQMSRVAAHG